PEHVALPGLERDVGLLLPELGPVVCAVEVAVIGLDASDRVAVPLQQGLPDEGGPAPTISKLGMYLRRPVRLLKHEDRCGAHRSPNSLSTFIAAGPPPRRELWRPRPSVESRHLGRAGPESTPEPAPACRPASPRHSPRMGWRCQRGPSLL